MTCPACTRAAQRSSYQFQHGCRGCAARSVAHLPQYREAKKLRDSRHRPYVLLLEAMGVTHEDVREAVKNDVALQREAAR